MRNWLDAARLTKLASHGRGFVVAATTGLPFVLKQGMEVHFVPPQIDHPRCATIISLEELDAGEAVALFDLEADRCTLMDMVGMHCVVRVSDVDLEELESPGSLIEGFAVIDEAKGILGTVAAVTPNPAHDLIEVSLADGHDGALLIPFVDEFVHGVDYCGNAVTVALPESLLGLNRANRAK